MLVIIIGLLISFMPDEVIMYAVWIHNECLYDRLCRIDGLSLVRPLLAVVYALWDAV